LKIHIPVRHGEHNLAVGIRQSGSSPHVPLMIFADVKGRFAG
jgi:hypothetical protein